MAAALCVAARVLHNEVALTILIFTFILGILAVSFNLIFGYTGQLSMFHAAAFGIAAYATASVDGSSRRLVLDRHC